MVLIDSVDEIAGQGLATSPSGSTASPLSLGQRALSLAGTAWSLVVHFDWVPNVTWQEDDEVRVALVYERALPSAPTNVRVTAPPGEDGTLEVSWAEAEEGHLSDRVLPRRIPPPERRGQEKKAVLSRLSRPRKGMRRQPADQRAAHGP